MKRHRPGTFAEIGTRRQLTEKAAEHFAEKYAPRYLYRGEYLRAEEVIRRAQAERIEDHR